MNNDFKNSYKNEMDKVMPSQESLDALGTAMTEKRSKKIAPVTVRRLIATAACLALVIGAAIPTALHFRGDGSTINPSEIIPTAKPLENATLSSYDDIYEIVSAAAKKYGYNGNYYYTYDGAMGEEVVLENTMTAIPTGGLDTMAPTATAKPEIADDVAESVTDTPEFSDTNLQEAGVQEADIIKTDGKYIYALSNNYLHIVKADDGSLTLISKIARRDNDDSNAPISTQEMYVSGDRLITINSRWKKDEELIKYEIVEKNQNSAKAKEILESAVSVETAASGNIIAMMPQVLYSFAGYEVEIYDITDRSAPALVNTLSVDGGYISSRMIGDTLYVITNKTVYNKIDADDPHTFIPSADGELLAPESIYIARDVAEIRDSNYLIVSGIDTSGEGKLVSAKSLFGFGSTVYCSKDNLYVTAYTDIEDESVRANATRIFKFSLDAGNVEFVAEGTVPGTVLNQFSLDEEGGYLRIVTTFQSWKYENVTHGENTYVSATQFEKSNCLYVLDADLSIVGRLEDLAPDEQIYSARFEGDIAYFVTFRQTDPLFTVDLSEPTAPKVLSELKIPGFSEYLHPWSDGLLFGFGKYANEITGKTGDLKLSMFDVSDKTDVTEAHTLTLTGNAYSAASYNHKAILINAQKNIIAFPTENNRYLVYSYNEKDGFTKEAEISLIDKIGAYNYYAELRGLFIGDFLYVYSPVGIASYNMTDYTFKASVNLD